MLETVKQLIKDTSKDFDSFYAEYVMDVQDANIEREVSHINICSFKDSNSINEMIDEMCLEVL